MSFIDSVSKQLQRGTKAVGRTTESTRLRMESEDLLKRRKDLAAQLGAALYEQTRNDPVLRSGREALYDGIAEIDYQRSNIDAQLAEIERMAAVARNNAMTYRCPGCGTSLSATDMFCKGCGKPIAEVKAAYASSASYIGTRLCPHCGSAMNEGDLFCMGCGYRVAQTPTEQATRPYPSTDSKEMGSDGSEAMSSAEDDMANVATAYAGTEAMSAVAPARHCPNCGSALKQGDAFCGVCGARQGR